MKTTKRKLWERNYETDAADQKAQNKYLRQIAYWVGYFIFAFNDLENTITTLMAEHIAGHSEKNEYAYIFLAELQFRQKVQLLGRMYHAILTATRDEELTKKAERILTEIKNFGDTRNIIVHANYYSLDKKGDVISKVKFENKAKFAKSGVEEHWVSITRDFLVESHNKAIDLTELIRDLDEDINNSW